MLTGWERIQGILARERIQRAARRIQRWWRYLLEDAEDGDEEAALVLSALRKSRRPRRR
jgi:hypothetical protein